MTLLRQVGGIILAAFLASWAVSILVLNSLDDFKDEATINWIMGTVLFAGAFASLIFLVN